MQLPQGYSDTVIATVETRFSFFDRLKVLFGCNLITVSFVATQNLVGAMQHTETWAGLEQPTWKKSFWPDAFDEPSEHSAQESLPLARFSR
jgi:hypothetical protein